MSRRARVVLVVLLSPLVLVLLAYLAYGVHGMVRVHRAEDRARADVAHHLQHAEGTAMVQQRDARRTRGVPSRSERRLECEIENVDAGWIVQDYVQECRVHTVDLFAGPDGLVESYTPVSRTSVGCSAWGLLFCSPPFEEPKVPPGVGWRPFTPGGSGS